MELAMVWWLHNAHVTACCPFRENGECAFCGWMALGVLAMNVFDAVGWTKTATLLFAQCRLRAERWEPGRLHRAWCRASLVTSPEE